MYKSFVGLWLLVFTPLFFLLYPSEFNPIIKFNTHIEEQRYIEIYSGTFDLIESTLSAYDEQAVVSEFNVIREQFGFDIVLTTAKQLGLNEKTEAAISNGNIVFINDEPEYLLKGFGNNGFVIQLYTDFSKDDEIYNSAKGTVSLIKQRFSELQQQELAAEISKLELTFPYELSLFSAEDVQPSDAEIQQLKTKGFFWREPSSSAVSFFIPVHDNSQFLAANLIPTSSVNASVIIVLIAVFVFVISVGMFLWVYPLWRDLNRLVAATEQLGQGELASRAFVSSISVVANLGKTFNLMADKLSQLLTGQRTLTNAIAHDLRTPLYRLKFALEMFEETTDDTKKSRYRASINNSIKDLDYLVNQTLILSRYSNEKELTTFADYDATSLVADEVTTTSSANEHLTWELNQINPAVKFSMDRLAVKRALNNLLSNACKYARSRIRVESYIASSKDRFIIVVSDDGPGVSDSEQENIFIPFVQSSGTSATGSSGHGLGLAIVRQIAKWHDGRVYVEKSNWGGAKFTLELAILPQPLATTVINN